MQTSHSVFIASPQHKARPIPIGPDKKTISLLTQIRAWSLLWGTGFCTYGAVSLYIHNIVGILLLPLGWITAVEGILAIVYHLQWYLGKMEEEEAEEIWVEYNTSLYGFALDYWGGMQQGKRWAVHADMYTDQEWCLKAYSC